MKRDESLSPSLFTFRSYFATVHRYYYYDFMTARGMRLPWAHRTRLQRLLLLLLTANVSNKSGNLLFAQSYPEQYENVGFVHSWCTVRLLIDFGLLPAPNGSGREVAEAVDWCRQQTEHMARLAIQALILGTRNAKTELDIRSDSCKRAGESSGQGIPSFRRNAWARKNYSTPST